MASASVNAVGPFTVSCQLYIKGNYDKVVTTRKPTTRQAARRAPKEGSEWNMREHRTRKDVTCKYDIHHINRGKCDSLGTVIRITVNK